MPGLSNCVRLTYEHLNSLNHFNYRETRELASNKHEQYSGSAQNNVKRGLEVPTNNVENGDNDGKYHHDENQQYPVWAVIQIWLTGGWPRRRKRAGFQILPSGR